MLTLLSLAQSRLMFNELNMTNSLAHHYSKLMNNHHIVMIGDSLTRYQYLSLVYLINTNTFYPANKKPSILWEGDHGNWNLFFNATNAALYPNEYCDCYRVGYINENRYFFNKERNITISYIAYFGDAADQKIHGHWSPHDNETNHQFHTPTLGDFVPYRWESNTILEALPDHAAKLDPKPSVLILNAGFWPNKYGDPDFRSSVLNLAVSLFDRVIWKTTNYDRDHKGALSLAICQHPGIECLNLDWTQYLETSDYKDRLHFQADIYTDIDIQFIMQLTHMNTTLSFVPLGPDFYGKVVQYHDKTFLVDQRGLLRLFTKPPQDAAHKACLELLNHRTHVQLPASTIKTHILGPNIPDICVAVGNPVSKGWNIGRG